MTRPSLWFVVESGTDVRIVDGFHQRFDLSIFARSSGGREVSQESPEPLVIERGPASRVRFALSVFFRIVRRKIRPDFILVQGYSLAAFAANMGGRLTGVPVAMFVCSPTEEYYRCRRLESDGEKPFRRHEHYLLDLLGRLNAVAGSRYVVLSRYLESVVEAHGGKNIEVIPLYGVDTSIFRPAEQPKHSLRRSRGLPDEGSIIFFSSRIAPEKDAVTLVEALRILVERGVDVRVLHRSGGYREFARLAERAGVGERVIATDAVHPVRELPLDYQASDVCVQASRAEGLGFSPLEALACRIPVVAAAVGGLRETIIDGETGWTYPVGDASVLAAAIEDVLSDADEGLRRAEAGRQLVEERYEREKAFDRFEALVRDIVARRRSDLAARSR